MAKEKSTILQRILNQEKQEQTKIEHDVFESQVLRPDKDELDVSENVIKSISQKFKYRISDEGLTDRVKEDIRAQVDIEVKAIASTYEKQMRLRKIILDSMFGLGPIEQYMSPKSTATDIIVHRYDHICVKDSTGTHQVDAEFNSEEHLRNVISRIVQQAGRQINLATPAVDAKLPDGSRIHATIPPVTPDGATLTVRRFNQIKLTPKKYIELETMSIEMLQFLKFCVEHKINILVAGGTDSGKTTLLNMLSSFIPDDELIVTIEDNCELQLKHPHVRRMEARQSTVEADSITIQDLVRHSLRMSPDRIIVGEVRDGSIVDMLSAMSIGHEGSMSTVHTDSPRTLMDSRLPTLFSQYNVHFQRETENLMIAEAVQIVVQISAIADSKRRVTHITAVNGIGANGNIELVDLFRYDRRTKSFYCTKNEPRILMECFNDKGCDMDNVKRMLQLK